MACKKILILPGDGIGPEIMRQAEKVLEHIMHCCNREWVLERGLIGGDAYDKTGAPLPEQTLDIAKKSDAILLGAVGGPKWQDLDRAFRPERGLLKIRSELGLFANLRPAILYDALVNSSTLKPAVIVGLDLLIVRELTGGIYFGEPRGIIKQEDGVRKGINTMTYNEDEIERIAHVAFASALRRNKNICSVDKANVLETTELWREVMEKVALDYPEVVLQHMYVDNAVMQLVRQPKQFDVIVTTNLFGDILSDLAAMLTGSIGMLPSASMNHDQQGMYEPVHGSAPDLVGQNVANPLAMILCVAMMLRYSLDELMLADKIEKAVRKVLENGLRTTDIKESDGVLDTPVASTDDMGDAVVAALEI